VTRRRITKKDKSKLKPHKVTKTQKVTCTFAKYYFNRQGTIVTPQMFFEWLYKVKDANYAGMAPRGE
jgi:hypothetical protein